MEETEENSGLLIVDMYLLSLLLPDMLPCLMVKPSGNSHHVTLMFATSLIQQKRFHLLIFLISKVKTHLKPA